MVCGTAGVGAGVGWPNENDGFSFCAGSVGFEVPNENDGVGVAGFGADKLSDGLAPNEKAGFFGSLENVSLPRFNFGCSFDFSTLGCDDG